MIDKTRNKQIIRYIETKNSNLTSNTITCLKTKDRQYKEERDRQTEIGKTEIKKDRDKT